MQQLTCFVITGFGEKTDPLTGRKLNLTAVYENIIKPVFDEFKHPDFDCFRACDKTYSGTIDAYMYKWIYEADFVVADISTLNPNAIYELGIRHALKPYSTIIICEDGLTQYPFDINHVRIYKYKHLGPDIGFTEVKRFSQELKELVKGMLQNQACDSPVYEYLKNDIDPPKKRLAELQAQMVQAMKENNEQKNPPIGEVLNAFNRYNDRTGNAVYLAPGENTEKHDSESLQKIYSKWNKMLNEALKNIEWNGIKTESTSAATDEKLNEKLANVLEKVKEEDPEQERIFMSRKPGDIVCLAELLKLAEKAKTQNNLEKALGLFTLALEYDCENKFIIQRIILVIYKLEQPDRLTSLKIAEEILKSNFNLEQSLDVETLALAGAIYKRMADEENEKENIDKSIKYYEKGYLVGNDYYNGINAAFMYVKKAANEKEPYDVISNFALAQKTWKNILELCDKKIKHIDEEECNELVWILQAKAQAKLGLNDGVINDELKFLLQKINTLNSEFSEKSFQVQNESLILLLDEVREKLKSLKQNANI